ncbi:tRNA pseudouridine(38-40) synthase TruA [Aureitalea marina]|uniref:tRNA pseudouridine synthase n=1 Tax=Aureitalea marina TaxID=930804 RepID=A0A2S7KP87_9FLAO|nr:tRNA pseudouridine(38-40) synthase TruA [Aureitalea marina]PQB04431.1 tRNA pseudouridine(38-40) synthase TruA [Aureitalea marina]
MRSERHCYLLEIQYLGFRYHGWQKQPGLKTVELMLSRTVSFVLGHSNFKILASGRTDAMVSSAHGLVELFLDDLPLTADFLENMNHNLPTDIRLLDLHPVDASFNVIDAPYSKTYIYLFAHGQKIHPFAAPLMTGLTDRLNIELMQQAALLFQGKHDLVNYVYKPNPETRTVVEIESCSILPNEYYQASFFPEESFALQVIGKGFKRQQIRLMMGALFDLGMGKYDLEFIKTSIGRSNRVHLDRIAPASGLILQSIRYQAP